MPELLSAMVYDHGSWDQKTGSVNPAVIVRGELPGPGDPFGVDRIYRGPSGSYDESFALLDPEGKLVYQQPYGRIILRGEMFEDHFRDTVRERITIASGGEHTMVFVIGAAEVGRIPVFIEAPESAVEAGALADALGESLKKTSIIWLTIPQPAGAPIIKPAWFVYDAGKVFVLTGPGEQDLTNIALADTVTLTARSKEERSEIASVPVVVNVVPNNSDMFGRVAQMGLGTRLNLFDGEAAFDRWRETCTLVELSPQR